ncbi:universal stress protein [soil metagenome]
MKTILVPTDFSSNAGKALNFAAEIASSASAEIILINVNTLVESPFRGKTTLEKKYNLPMQEAIIKELDELCKEVSETIHVRISSQTYGGTVVNSIVAAAEDYKADMIIMGTLGDTGFKEKLIGSVTAAIIGKVNIPVLAVPLLSEWTVPKNMLLAINHFDEQPMQAKAAVELAKLFYAKLTVAVFTDQDTALAVDYIGNTRGVLSYGHELESIYKDTSIEPARLYGHRFEETIDQYIKENEVDVLVMFTHKRSLVGSIFNRSMTKKMSYHTNIPLLAIPVE